MKDGQCLPLANTEYTGVGSRSIGITIIITPVHNCLAQPEKKEKCSHCKNKWCVRLAMGQAQGEALGPTHRCASRGLIPWAAHCLC